MGDKNRELHYIFAGTGIAAIIQRGSSVDSMFYVHPDHLGSPVLITDENGDVYEEKSFDAFGRLRDPEDWSEIFTEGNFRFDRGYTGHEHLEKFGLINMNGRMFDPHTARFLSPDLFVQDPALTQCFNRYSYCLNNPLRFVDPEGHEYIMHDIWGRRYEVNYHSSHVLVPAHRHLDGGGGSSGYSYDPSSPTGYRNASGNVVSWGEVYNNYVLPNSTAVKPGLFYDVLLDAQSGNLRIINMYGQDWFVYVNPSSGKLTSYMSLTVSKLNSYYNIPSGQGDTRKDPLFEFVGFNRGIPEFESRLMPEGSAVTPGPFIIYSSGYSNNKVLNTHEPGHVIQFFLLGGYGLYIPLVAIPSLLTVNRPYHNEMPWEKSANQLWYWLTGENHPRNPLYFNKPKN